MRTTSRVILFSALTLACAVAGHGQSGPADMVNVSRLGVHGVFSQLVTAANMYSPPLVTERYVYTGDADQFKFEGAHVAYNEDQILFHVPHYGESYHDNRYIPPAKGGFLHDLRLPGTFSITIYLAEDLSLFKKGVTLSIGLSDAERGFASWSLTREADGTWTAACGDRAGSERFYGYSGVRALQIEKADDGRIFYRASMDGENFDELLSTDPIYRPDSNLPLRFIVEVVGVRPYLPSTVVVDELVVEYERIAGYSPEEVAAKAIEEALAESRPDVNRDGKTDAVDLQTVINRILNAE